MDTDRVLGLDRIPSVNGEAIHVVPSKNLMTRSLKTSSVLRMGVCKTMLETNTM